jgi:transcriptional regulator with XRE-family HTH domain
MNKRTTVHEQLVVKLSDVMKARRERLGISQSELGKRSGLHRSYIGDLERGARNISVRNLSRMAMALGLSAPRLLAMAERGLRK